MGVEEEFLLVDPQTGVVTPAAAAVLRSAHHSADSPSLDGGGGPGGVERELMREQVETVTIPCATAAELRAELQRLRRGAGAAAAEAGVALAAMGSSPLPATPTLTPKQRYLRMQDEYGITAGEQLSCGCHVHVAVDSRAEAVGVLDRIREWLPTLLALSVNSPFHDGRDTGYASYRAQLWDRWPSAGASEPFGSETAYDTAVQDLLTSGAVMDRGMIYFLARPSEAYPTVEIRSADVCRTVEDAVLLAVLCRALVSTAAREWAAGEPAPDLRTDLVRVAHWRASRSGLSGELVDLRARRAVPAAAALEALVTHTAAALEETGDAALVDSAVARMLAGGTGADLQRASYARRRSLADVVAGAVRATVEGEGPER